METFQEVFETEYKRQNIEPLNAILKGLAMKRSLISGYINDQGKTTAAVSASNQSYPNELNLQGQTIPLKVSKALATALENDKVFTRVMLGDTLLGDDGCIVLSEALKKNDTIEVLELKGNNIRSDGAIALGKMLKVNQSIKTLVLEWNCLGIWESGFQGLVEPLSMNSTLEDLDLRNNRIGPNGGVYLAKHLKSNTGLRRVDLRWNALGLIGGRALLDALKWNQTLLYLDLAGNDVPDDIGKAIEMALDRNRERERLGKESATKAKYLSSTIQQISVEHEENIQALRNKLMLTEVESKALNEKLNVASDELHHSHAAYKVLQAKLNEEKILREKLNEKFEELETSIVRERKDFTERCQSLLHDFVKEREQRARMEDEYSTSIRDFKEKILSQDAAIKQSELNIELASREKAAIQQENEKLRSQLLALNSEKDEHVHRMSASIRRDSDRINEENAELNRRLEMKDRQLVEMQEKMRAMNAETENRFRSMEQSIRQEENNRRQELINRLNSLAQQRDQIQATLMAQLTTAKQEYQDLEIKFNAERSETVKLKAQVGELSKHAFSERSLRDKCEQIEEENSKYKRELAKMYKKLDKYRQEEVSRAKQLERAIVGYVKTVEKSNDRLDVKE